MTPKQAELLQMVNEQDGYGFDFHRRSDGTVKLGSVYVLLSQLRDKGFVGSKEVPPEPGKRGPAKVVYHATERGTQALDLWTQLKALETQER